MKHTALSMLSVLTVVVPAVAQDIRGIENCTVEKTMERRTGCLQNNVDFLQQALARQRRESRAMLDAVSRDLTAQKSEITALKSELARLQQELADLKKSKPDRK